MKKDADKVDKTTNATNSSATSPRLRRNSDQDLPQNDFLVNFETTGGTGIGLDRRDPRFSAKTIEMLELLQSFEKTKSCNKRKVGIRFCYLRSKRTEDKGQQDRPVNLMSLFKFAWAPYWQLLGAPTPKRAYDFH